MLYIKKNYLIPARGRLEASIPWATRSYSDFMAAAGEMAMARRAGKNTPMAIISAISAQATNTLTQKCTGSKYPSYQDVNSLTVSSQSITMAIGVTSSSNI